MNGWMEQVHISGENWRPLSGGGKRRLNAVSHWVFAFCCLAAYWEQVNTHRSQRKSSLVRTPSPHYRHSITWWFHLAIAGSEAVQRVCSYQVLLPKYWGRFICLAVSAAPLWSLQDSFYWKRLMSSRRGGLSCLTWAHSARLIQPTLKNHPSFHHRLFCSAPVGQLHRIMRWPIVPSGLRPHLHSLANEGEPVSPEASSHSTVCTINTHFHFLISRFKV